jgi:hypothetical protein
MLPRELVTLGSDLRPLNRLRRLDAGDAKLPLAERDYDRLVCNGLDVIAEGPACSSLRRGRQLHHLIAAVHRRAVVARHGDAADRGRGGRGRRGLGRRVLRAAGHDQTNQGHEGERTERRHGESSRLARRGKHRRRPCACSGGRLGWGYDRSGPPRLNSDCDQPKCGTLRRGGARCSNKARWTG